MSALGMQLRGTVQSAHKAPVEGPILSLKRSVRRLLDEVVGGGEKPGRYVEAERFGRREIDRGLELRRRLYREVARLLAAQDGTT